MSNESPQEVIERRKWEASIRHAHNRIANIRKEMLADRAELDRLKTETRTILAQFDVS